MGRKALLKSIKMYKSLATICVLILLPLLVPCEIFAKGKTTRVSVSSSGVQGNGNCLSPSISSDGRYVAFESKADNLVAGDTNGNYDIFVHDRLTGQTTLVSVSSSGVQGDDSCWSPSISSDARFVAFDCIADNLVADDSNNADDIFVHDRQTGQTTLVSVSSSGVQGNGNSYSASISFDGRYVVFGSDADNLVAGDTNNVIDVFEHDRLPESAIHTLPCVPLLLLGD